VTAPTKAKAVHKLARSQLDPAAIQRELMGDDVDIDKLLVYLQSTIQFNIAERVTDITVTRTIEGASTLIVTVSDNDRAVLRSNCLREKMDVEIDKLWFRLVKVEGSGNNLVLTFEDREISVLRTYKKHKTAHRSQVTRAEFILNLIREVKEFKIPVVIPQLHKTQPIQKSTDMVYKWDQALDTTAKTSSVPTTTTDASTAQDRHRHGETSADVQNRTLTVKGVPIKKEQLYNANLILATGASMGVNDKVLVSGITTAITESTLYNNPSGMGTSVGLFQQIDTGWGSFQDRMDPVTSSKMYYEHAIKEDKNVTNLSVGELCQAVQKSGFPTHYQPYVAEAAAITAAYSGVGLDLSVEDLNNMQAQEKNESAADFIFYRGDPVNGGKTWKKEDSWTCITRLANEVDWRAFFVSGVFYFVTDKDLFVSSPVASISAETEGIDSFDFDYDVGKKSATVTVTARVGTWLVPPGAVVLIEEMGPLTGRWLVNTFERSLYDSQATITLKKPQPKLPEPIQNDVTAQSTWSTVNLDTSPETQPMEQSDVHGGGFIPTANKYTQEREDQGRDLTTNPGGPIVAPGNGKCVHNLVDPNGFGTNYAVVEFSDGPYAGKMIYIGHCMSLLKPGQKFVPGQRIAKTGTTGTESWNGNASQPGWAEIGFAPGGYPGPWGQGPPF
jgi:hypothetical protein